MRLPPLNALRFFEAAARHLSFTRAAQELQVTQAAVSQQIKTLETYLGVALFRRQPRRLLLSDEGQILLPEVQEAFLRLAQVSERLSGLRESGTLVVLVRPYFAARWLSPRLSRFWERHPNIDLRLHHSNDPAELSAGEFDVAVRWGRGDWPESNELLLPVEVTPVCSPQLTVGPNALRTPRDLPRHMLLHDSEDDLELWARWLALAGVHGVELRHGRIIDDTLVRTQAAIDGQGVTFGAIPLLADDLATGRLVAPFDLNLDDAFAYYIVYPPGAAEKPKVEVFIRWLLEEAENDRAATSALQSESAH